MIDEARFFAWLDGELSEADAAEVERQVADDPQLARQAQEHRDLGAGLRNAFGSVADAPQPRQVLDLFESRSTGNIVSIADATRRRTRRSPAPRWRQFAALAATLLFGIVAGHQFAQNPSDLVDSNGSRLIASGALDAALDTRLASAPAGEGLRMGLTFRDRTGTICRTFEDQAASGLACRDKDDWRILGLFQQSAAQPTDYRMASGANPRLLALVDEQIAGAPFDAPEERSARNAGWR